MSNRSSVKAARLCTSPGTSFNRLSVHLRVMTPQLPVFCLPYTFLGAIQKFSRKYRKKWICFLVRANQEYSSKVKFAIIVLLNRCFTDRRPETLSVDDLKDLRYLECVIKVLKYFIFC